MPQPNQERRTPQEDDERRTSMAVRVIAGVACVPLALWSLLGITGVAGKFVDAAQPAVLVAAVGAGLLGYVAFRR